MSSNETQCEPLGTELARLTLSNDNKAEILYRGLEDLTESAQLTSKGMENMQKWDPDFSSLFMQRSQSIILDTPFALTFKKRDLSSFDKTGLYVHQYLAYRTAGDRKTFFPLDMSDIETSQSANLSWTR